MPDTNDPDDLMEMAEDRCVICGKYLGFGVRWLHVGLCETCADLVPPPKDDTG